MGGWINDGVMLVGSGQERGKPEKKEKKKKRTREGSEEGGGVAGLDNSGGVWEEMQNARTQLSGSL